MVFSNHCLISIRASGFHLEDLREPDNRANITASNGDSCWVQFELTDIKLVPTGYRLRRSPDLQLRSWSLRTSNDPSLPLGQWTSLDRRHEEREGEFNDFASFPCFGEAFPYFPLVMEGPSWDASTNLFFATSICTDIWSRVFERRVETTFETQFDGYKAMSKRLTCFDVLWASANVPNRMNGTNRFACWRCHCSLEVSPLHSLR
jgi:hypothetical protein